MSGWWVVSYVALWALVLGIAVVSLVVLRQLGLIYLRSRTGGPLQLEEGPAIGMPMRFRELDSTGVPVVFPDRSAPLSLALFTSPWCPICDDTLDGLSAVLPHFDISVVVIDAGDENESPAHRVPNDDRVRLVHSLLLQRRIGVTTIPFAIVTDETGVVLNKGIVNHIEDLEDLLSMDERHDFLAAST